MLPRRAIALSLLALASVAASARAPGASTVGATTVAYVNVSMATLWTRPNAPRAIDRPALQKPVDTQAWPGALTTAQRLGLVGRVETQVLFGEPVLVVERRGRWARIFVPDQPTPRNRRGYPGWVPYSQLVAAPAFGQRMSEPSAVVTARTAWLRWDARRMELSYGTRLPVVGTAGVDVLVATPGGAVGRLSRSSVAILSSTIPVRPTRGREIVAATRTFLGVRYVWGGTSAFGFDCSGLIHLVYRAHGVTIPRDADAQARAGRPIARALLRPGDLVFYGITHVQHVALFVGSGRMIEAPNSSSSVRLTAVRTADYAGARRFLR